MIYQTKTRLTFAVCLLFLFLLAPMAKTCSAQATLEQAPPKQQKEAEPDDDDSDSSEQESEQDNDQSEDEQSKSDKKPELGQEDSDDAQSEQPKFLNRIQSRFSANRKYSKEAKDLVEVFSPVVASASESTVVVLNGKSQIAMGMVIDSDGMILTKASALKGDLKCKLSNGKAFAASVYGVDPDTDLALLKIEVDDLVVAPLSDGPVPSTGRWLASPDIESKLVGIGVVSVDERVIPPSKPFIGIEMRDVANGGGVRISRVLPGTAADRAGIRVNDVIIKLDDIDIPERMTLVETLGQYSIGDIVKISVRRGDNTLRLGLLLGDRDKDSPQNDRSNTQNNMGSTLSKRRKNFPMAFQHDSMLSAKDCGGAIVDLNGRVVGVNIARAGRVSSLALPLSVVEPVVEKLKTGEYAPMRVNAVKIKKVDSELNEIVAVLDALPDKKSELEKKLLIEEARKEELEKSLKEIKQRLDAIEERTTNSKREFKDLSRRIRAAKNSKRTLESKLKKLKTGAN